jgi:hypothetical protein
MRWRMRDGARGLNGPSLRSEQRLRRVGGFLIVDEPRRREQTRDAAPRRAGARDAAVLDWTTTPQAQQTGLRGLNEFYRRFWEARR